MREYNTFTDYEVLRTAIFGVGKTGGFLTATRQAFQQNNIRWPVCYNSDNSLTVQSLESDIGKVLHEFTEACGS